MWHNSTPVCWWYVHGSDMYVHVYTRWVGFQMTYFISKPGCYYVTLFLFRYIISIMTLLCPIMTLLYHLFFCKCPDYYFSLFHYLQKDYYFTYDTSIISLIFFVIYYCFYCYYNTTIGIIFISYYYNNYIIRKVLYWLFVFVPIFLIMTIMTLYFYYFYRILLWLLFYSKSIISFICFRSYYLDYIHYDTIIWIIFL